MTKILTKDHEFWRELNCNKTNTLTCVGLTRISVHIFHKNHDKTHKLTNPWQNSQKSAICNRTERFSRMRRQNAPMFTHPTPLVTHARDNWWTLDSANAFVSPGVNSRGGLVPSHGASRRRLGDKLKRREGSGSTGGIFD
jgi:hypothetical protein